MKHLPLILILSILTGCGTHMPRETALLSAKLGPELQESKRSHRAILGAWIKAEREKVEILLHYSWVPTYIKNFLAEPMVKKAFKEEICSANAGKMDRALVIQEMMEDMTVDIEAKRRKEFSRIRKLEVSFKAALRDHHDHISRMYSSLHANVLSVQKSLALEKHIREAMEKPIKQVIPLDKARKTLDQLFELGD